MALKEQKTVLLIDDENVVSDYVKELLTDEDYNVLTAGDGLDGIDVFSQHFEEIDAVILDMVMPLMHGTDCFYELKDIDPDVKVIIISGYTRMSGVEYLMKDGVKAFIKKPFKGSALVDEIDEVIHGGN